MRNLGILSIVSIAIASTFACGSGNKTSNDSVASGSLGLTVKAPGNRTSANKMHADLLLPDGEDLSSISYNLSNGINTYTGTGNLPANLPTDYFLIGPVLPGVGYTVSLSGTTPNVTCVGYSGSFDITPGNVSQVIVNILCTETNAGDSGAVEVAVNASDCPVWEYATLVGQSSNPHDPWIQANQTITLLVEFATPPNDTGDPTLIGLPPGTVGPWVEWQNPGGATGEAVFSGGYGLNPSDATSYIGTVTQNSATNWTGTVLLTCPNQNISEDEGIMFNIGGFQCNPNGSLTVLCRKN